MFGEAPAAPALATVALLWRSRRSTQLQASSAPPLFPLICAGAGAVFFAATGIYSVAQCSGSRSHWTRSPAKQVLSMEHISYESCVFGSY